ncbi:histone-like nucleoid-structuring protein Lsr2 [Mycolicibacterium llatzerense]|uniref:histone-like nucleoid-structuring protein Lsr2 n=1 Tax=Mycolicibacterium llatzerense TaxID=280871 RepID=UPI0021B6CC46|nr:Lsr2 family protein [Mycolicibacterium llatzerense]MCT7371939.1 hypothetical protein [Mycolicibacterium llatzerense]
MPAFVTTEYVDDLDNTSIDEKDVDTVQFSYRGNEFTLVLTKENGSKFDKDIARYIKAAKKAQAQVTRGAKATPAKSAKGAQKTTGKDTAAAAPAPRKAAAARKTASARKAAPARKAVSAEKTAPTRKAASPRKVTSSKAVVSVDERSRAKAIREWATANGHTVSERGRISAALVHAFEAATSANKHA